MRAPVRASQVLAVSRRAQPRDPVDADEELLPQAALGGQDFGAFGSEPVVTASPLARLFDPPPLDLPFCLEAVEHWVERRYVEGDRAARPVFDLPRDFVPVSLAILEDGEDEELGAPLLHFGRQCRLGHIWCDNISSLTV